MLKNSSNVQYKSKSRPTSRMRIHRKRRPRRYLHRSGVQRKIWWNTSYRCDDLLHTADLHASYGSSMINDLTTTRIKDPTRRDRSFNRTRRFTKSYRRYVSHYIQISMRTTRYPEDCRQLQRQCRATLRHSRKAHTMLMVSDPGPGHQEY